MTSALIEPLRSWIEKCPPDQPWLIGFSGGADSVALTEALLLLGYEHLILIHVHHQLRGASADADAAWVTQWGHDRHLPVHIIPVDVPHAAREQKLSLETAARQARYRIFEQSAQRYQAGGIFLAHQADDQLETLLFRLLRGTARPGLCGMSAETILDSGLRVYRPLLSTTRDQLISFLRERSLDWREDESNQSLDYTRNRLRHQLIPLCTEIMQRDPRPLVAQTARLLADEEEWLTALTHSWLRDHAPDVTRLPIAALRLTPIAQQRRILYHWLQAQQIPLISYDTIESVRHLLEPQATPARVNLPQGYRARRRSGHLFIDQQNAHSLHPDHTPLPPKS